MSEQAIEWFDIGTLPDIPVRGARRVDINGNAVAVFRTATDEVFAINDQCPHQGGPLSQGIVHGDCVTCPLHNWVISLRDGQAQGADEGHTQHYRIKIEDDRLKLGVHSAAHAANVLPHTDEIQEELSA